MLMARKKSFASVLEDNYIYISHLDEKFQFWKLPTWPDTVADTMTTNFQSTNALGRTAPVYTFSNAGPRTVQISIPLHRDIMDEVNIGISNVFLGEGEDYVDNLLKALQSIAVPKYNLQNKAVEPPIVAIRLSNEIFIKGVVTGSIGLTYSKPILSNGKYARIDLSITVSEVDPYDATSVFKNGGFRGVVRGLKKGMNLED
jgi:hypothetical protein